MREALMDILKGCGYPYEVIYHEAKLHSAQEGADYFGIGVGQTAPTLIINTEKGFMALIVSGARERVDFVEVAAFLSCKWAKLAARREAEQLTGSTVGSIQMVGLDLPCIIDRRLFAHSFVYGGLGTEGATLKISPNALLDLNKVAAMLD